MDVIWWNCGGSLKGKIDAIKFHVDKYKPAAIFISESDSNIEDLNLVGVPGYDLVVPTQIVESFFRIAAYVHEGVKYKQFEISESPNVIGIRLLPLPGDQSNPGGPAR